VQPDGVARLPEHEVRDDCEGPKPTVDDDMPRFKYAAPGLTRKHLRCRQQIHTRTAVRAFLDRERRLKNLFQQIALIHACRRTYPQALSLLQQHNLVRVFRGEIELVSDDNDSVAILHGQSA